MINVSLEKNANENSINLLKRFTKRVQSAGVLPRVRSLRYSKRKASPYVKQKRTLTVLKRRAHAAELAKMGKTPEKHGR